jgi:hypothetical protein
MWLGVAEGDPQPFSTNLPVYRSDRMSDRQHMMEIGTGQQQAARLAKLPSTA